MLPAAYSTPPRLAVSVTLAWVKVFELKERLIDDEEQVESS